MKNFFATAENTTRKSPVQISGDVLTAEVHMKDHNYSKTVVNCRGFKLNDGEIAMSVEVTDPITGKVLFTQILTCNKKG